jgi:hypothetical protein
MIPLNKIPPPKTIPEQKEKQLPLFAQQLEMYNQIK